MPSNTERVGPPSTQPPSTQPISSGSDAEGTTSKLSSKLTEKETLREPCRASEQPTQLEEFDQCGLEDDGIEWAEWDGPKRIKETKATAEEQTKYRDILNRCFSPITVMGVRALFHPEEVLDVMVKAQKYFESEPVLIEDIPFGVTIVGDIHGQLHDLYRVFRAHGTNKGKQSIEGFESSKYLFLGDYVDRGRQSLEVVMALFTLKILYPDNFFLLRGNHEFMTVNMTNGFSKEMRQRYDKETAEALFYQINDAFNYLSIAAIVGNSYFCVHAGVSPMGFTRNQLRGLTKPYIFADEDILVNDMVWADPAVGLRGTVFNTERRTSIFFGMDALVTALTSVDCVALFRGHDMMKDGFDNQMNICFTVFTATAVYEGDNNGACVAVDGEGRITVIRLAVDNERADRDKRLFPVDEDVKTVCERTTGELATIGS